MNFLTAKWENIIMANYAVSPEVLNPYLPNGVELDLFNGKAYVSLVGFIFKKTKLFKIPIPYLGTFEEINLRFYVIRKDGDKIKRGVVFINETIPYKMVAWMANKLYKEHYTTVATKHFMNILENKKQIEYQWKVANYWNKIFVEATTKQIPIKKNSMEEFIFEHYYGYTKFNELITQEYLINHPRWNVNEVLKYKIECNFKEMYGNEFKMLNNQNPESVFIAEGSDISVQWKRTNLNY